MTSFLWLALFLPAEAPPTKLPPIPVAVAHTEKYLGQFSLNGIPLAVMFPTTQTFYSKTSNLGDAQPTPYFDIPDEDTELVEIAIDLRRRVVLKMVYVTKKEI